jgi:HD-GYP domain-containing protein (c-di-GMP phosphodiesterase class II)/DNA-binding CsgD family transcriptional regulator
MEAGVRAGGVGVGELLGVLSLAIDLGSGQPQGHGLRTCVLAVGLARELGLDEPIVADVHRVALLRFLGCTSDGAETARMGGGNDVAFRKAMAPAVMGERRAMLGQLARTMGPDGRRLGRVGHVAAAVRNRKAGGRALAGHCEVGAMLAAGLGMGEGVLNSLAHAFERWDGRGIPAGLAGEEVPWPVRVVVVARDAELFSRLAPEELDGVLQARRGRAYDPVVVDVFAACGERLLAEIDGTDAWEAALDCDPATRQTMTGEELDAALRAIAEFTDLKSPWTRAHSVRVAELAGAATTSLGHGAEDAALARRAGLVHDLGQVGVPFCVWDRPAGLGPADWELVRCHTLWAERALGAASPLRNLASLVGAHHERLDGSGYHRQLDRARLGGLARVLAAADVHAALAEPRPHRPALDPAPGAGVLYDEVNAGRLDRDAVDAVLAAAGQPTARPRRGWPRGLSDREVDVLRLIARGRTNRDVAGELHLSVKTVGRHVENLYVKIGVSSRAAAALFAMQERLLDP